MLLSDFVNQSSKNPVIDGVIEIGANYLDNQEIISPTNPLITNGIQSLKDYDDDLVNYSIPQTAITTFLAASSLGHLLDGWLYLSNAFQVLLNGDTATAIHLAYYAELRSSMSLLATEGIGIFDQKHIGVFSSTTNSVFPKNYYKGVPPNTSYKRVQDQRTHEFVWKVMEEWLNSPNKPDADLLKIFTVRGESFYSLIEFFHPSTSGTIQPSIQVIKDWLQECCFDI